jgi:hypothetical protein
MLQMNNVSLTTIPKGAFEYKGTMLVANSTLSFNEEDASEVPSEDTKTALRHAWDGKCGLCGKSNPKEIGCVGRVGLFLSSESGEWMPFYGGDGCEECMADLKEDEETKDGNLAII